MRIISTDTDKNSDPNYCAWANVAVGHVLSISDETGREGGELWSKGCKYPEAGGGMPAIMKQLARNWPNFYKKVRKEAFRDNLPTLEFVQKGHRLYDLSRIDVQIDSLEDEINGLKKKRRKLERKS